jgi:hypothetical protein
MRCGILDQYSTHMEDNNALFHLRHEFNALFHLRHEFSTVGAADVTNHWQIELIRLKKCMNYKMSTS